MSLQIDSIMTMTPRRKYQLMLLTTVVAFVYIVSTEVFDRYGQLYTLFTELQAKEQLVREPKAVDQERRELLERQGRLKQRVRSQSGAYEQSRTGVLEFVNVSATTSVVRLESLVPSRAELPGGGQGMGFKMSLIAPFHRTALFLNQLENGPFALRITKLEVTREGASQGAVKAAVEGTVLLGDVQ